MSTFEGPDALDQGGQRPGRTTPTGSSPTSTAGTLGWVGFMTFGMLYWLHAADVPGPAVEQEAGERPLLDRHHRHPAVHRADLRGRPDAGADVAGASTPQGNLCYPDFVETVLALMPMYWLRAVGGTLYLAGARAVRRQLPEDLGGPAGQVRGAGARGPGAGPRLRRAARPESRLEGAPVHRVRPWPRRVAARLVAPPLGAAAAAVHDVGRAARWSRPRCSRSCRCS